jgi:hypothetical protein
VAAGGWYRLTLGRDESLTRGTWQANNVNIDDVKSIERRESLGEFRQWLGKFDGAALDEQTEWDVLVKNTLQTAKGEHWQKWSTRT